MKIGKFADFYRGDGIHVSSNNWTVALRNRCHFRFVRPPGKPGYIRLYMGFIEIEYRKP